MPLLYDYFREWYPERETQQFDCNEMNYFKKQCKTIVLVKSNSAFGVLMWIARGLGTQYLSTNK